MRGRTGGARFTGASASLKLVSGKSARGVTDTQTAAPNRTRIKIQRSRFTPLTPIFQKYSGEYCLSMIDHNGWRQRCRDFKIKGSGRWRPLDTGRWRPFARVRRGCSSRGAPTMSESTLAT